MNIHVSNLHLNLIEHDVQRLFIAFGEVTDITIVRDKLNNRSRGRAFLDMPVEKQRRNAIAGLDGMEVKGKKISVREVMYDPSISTHLISNNV
ncbi:MAG TPA: RNA-binding protein [Flavisolibacter sp.]